MSKFLNNINLEAGNDIQFKTTAGANAGKIEQDGNNLVLSNTAGDVLLGDGSSDVYIGDGTNNVDILFEQSGSIKGDGSAITLTIGGANTTLNLENPNINGTLSLGATSINNKLTFTTANGYILFDHEPSGDTGAYEGTTSVPLLKIDTGGTEKSILERVSQQGGILLGADDSVIIAAGDTRNTLRSNLDEAAETVIFASEGGFHAYGFPNNLTDWSNRNEFRFRSDSATASDNGLYIGDGSSTQFIDLSRNLKNIGTIGAGTITSTGHVAATEFRPTNIVTNKVVKFNGTQLDDANITDTGSLITLGSNTTLDGVLGVEVGNAFYSTPLLEITSSGTPTQIKITTNIPWSSTQAHVVTIRGFQYGGAQMADLQIGWHVYNNSFYNRAITSSGSWAPVVRLAVENSKVVIHLDAPGYWPKLYVESLYNAFGGTDDATGWSWADAAISADSGTPNQTVPYKINFGGGEIKAGSDTVWHAGNDGSGSGLDADLLDGNEASAFMGANGMALNTDFFMNFRVMRNSNSTTSNDGMYIGYGNSNGGATRIYGGGSTNVHLDVTATNMAFNSNTVWHAGNDGTGSGLDADLLDAQEGSYYRNASNLNAGTVAADRLSTASTQPPNDNSTKIATTAYVQTEIGDLIGGAPAALDTLNELAAAIGDDASYASSITTALAAKAPLASPALTGAVTVTGSGSSGNAFAVMRGSDSAQVLRIQNTGEVVVQNNYLYAASSGTSLYVQNSAVFRGSISNDASGQPVTIGDDLYVSGDLTIGSGSSQSNLHIKKADNDVSDHIVFYNGTTRVGEIGVEDTTWLRINQETAKNIYTPRYIRADGGFFVDGASKGIDGSGNFVGGTITGASDANVSNWNTAYGWGNHASAGYLTSSSTQSKYLRSDATDTATGALTLSNTGNTFNGHHYFSAYDAAGNHFPHYLHGSSGSAKVNIRVYNAGGGSYDSLYIAAGNNDITWRGNKIWNAGNDGSGSGLDADLLDGVHKSSFLRSDAADTATGLLTLNGGVHILSGTGGGKLRIKRNSTSSDGDDITDIHMDDSGIYFDIDNDNDNDTANVTFRYKTGGSFTNTLVWTTSGISYKGNTIWHAGNDGSGSGLDADTVDGVHASSFLTSYTETDTLATVTARGATTTTALTINRSSGTMINTGAQSDAFGYNSNYGHYIRGNSNTYIYGNGTLYTGGAARTLFHDTYHPNADTLTTARTIAGASFNGSANIDISYNNLTNKPTIPSDYSLPEATATTRGGIELFSNTDQSVAANSVSATASRTYGIQLNSAGQAVVNVPWSDTNTDTNTTYTAGSGLTLSGTEFSHSDTSSQSSSANSGRTYIQSVNLDGQGHVTGLTTATETVTNTDTNTTYSAGRGLDLSGTEFQLETDLRDTISYIGYDSNDYIQWSNNSYCRTVVAGTERFRVNTDGIDVNGVVVANAIRTDAASTSYSLITRNTAASNYVMYVQATQSGGTQKIATFGYGSGTAGQATEVFRIARGQINAYSSNLTVGGSITGTSKNFSIPHPTKEGKRLVHSCIEGPEIGVYFRGRSQSSTIEMPDYWGGLVDLDSMTVELTAIGPNQDLYVEDIADDGDVTVGSNTETALNYFYVVYGERKDMDKLEIEVDDTGEFEGGDGNSEDTNEI